VEVADDVYYSHPAARSHQRQEVVDVDIPKWTDVHLGVKSWRRNIGNEAPLELLFESRDQGRKALLGDGICVIIPRVNTSEAHRCHDLTGGDRYTEGSVQCRALRRTDDAALQKFPYLLLDVLLMIPAGAMIALWTLAPVQWGRGVRTPTRGVESVGQAA
jgi:hypothetical protein